MANLIGLGAMVTLATLLGLTLHGLLSTIAATVAGVAMLH